jgi:hypothetical protein
MCLLTPSPSFSTCPYFFSFTIHFIISYWKSQKHLDSKVSQKEKINKEKNLTSLCSHSLIYSALTCECVCLWILVVLQISWKIPIFFVYSICFASPDNPVCQMSLLMAIQSLSAIALWHSHRKWSSVSLFLQWGIIHITYRNYFPCYDVTMCCSGISCRDRGQDHFLPSLELLHFGWP